MAEINFCPKIIPNDSGYFEFEIAYEFYKNDFVQPKKSVEDFKEYLCENLRFVFKEVKFKECSRMTQASLEGYVCNNTRIWVVENNKIAQIFFKDLYSRWVMCEDSIQLCFLYLEKLDMFWSNSPLFSAFLNVYRGISYEDDKRNIISYVQNIYEMNRLLVNLEEN